MLLFSKYAQVFCVCVFFFIEVDTHRKLKNFTLGAGNVSDKTQGQIICVFCHLKKNNGTSNGTLCTDAENWNSQLPC